jgi:H+/Cl- antiporter ClcA
MYIKLFPAILVWLSFYEAFGEVILEERIYTDMGDYPLFGRTSYDLSSFFFLMIISLIFVVFFYYLYKFHRSYKLTKESIYDKKSQSFLIGFGILQGLVSLIYCSFFIAFLIHDFKHTSFLIAFIFYYLISAVTPWICLKYLNNIESTKTNETDNH